MSNGLDGMVIIGCRESKSTFGANNVQKYQLFLGENDRELAAFRYIDY